MTFTECLQNRGVVLFRRDVKSGWLRAETREREADVIVVRGVPVARRGPPPDVAVRYELCPDHPPKVYRQEHREWTKICKCCHCKHEPEFSVFVLEEDRVIRRGDFKCVWCASGGDMVRPVAKGRVLGCDGCGCKVPWFGVRCKKCHKII